MVFDDEKSKDLLRRIELLAPSELNVLIIGETGTGKELVARHIHALSNRRDASFFAVNCGALAESLMDSELFGHEKGAFTGATTTKIGWFEAASGGSLFLDEIGDLSMSMQVKLLRVLQEREIVRVGSHRPIPINVRVIAATNVKLEEAVLAGRFREDLYYRLNAASLTLPALRYRTGDIMPLARHFLDFYGQRLGCAQTVLSETAQNILLKHAWPGNIRELENVIHHALMVARNNVITPQDLNLSTLTPRNPMEICAAAGLDGLDLMMTKLCESGLPDLYAEVEQSLLRAAYRHCNHNQLAASRLLGMSRHVVRAKLLHYGIIDQNQKAAPILQSYQQRMPKSKSQIPVAADSAFKSWAQFDAQSPDQASTEWWGY